MAHAITIKTDLGDKLLFSSMTATEQLGRLFTFEVRLLSKDAQVKLRDLLGTSMTVKLTLDNGYERHFNGIVCEAGQTGFESFKDERYAEYSVRLVPKPWLLTRKADCRIYKAMTVPDIVKKVLSEIGYSDVKLSLSGTYPKRDYCVQYREDYFNFISRLMEQEGIYYYFQHTASTHTMVLADALGAHSKAKGFDELPYVPEAAGVRLEEATISEWKTARSVHSTHYQVTDYDPMKPKASLLAPEVIGNLGELHHVAGLEVFDFPGDHHVLGDGARYAQVRVESLNVPQSQYSGATNACGLATGGLFKLKEFPRKELNQEYLIVGATTRLVESAYASGGHEVEAFGCSFEAIESRQPFRSLQTTMKPVVVGLQTAVVCGSEDAEDIVVDKYGRIQVIFHWNKTDKPKHDISCPVRVSTPWAGKQWGAVHIPRVGQEVVVSFLEGDPDRPLIIGSVYNADNMPPYALPDNKTQSGIKSRSHKGGGADNFNEIRFEDKMGSEELFMHAEKDMREEVEHDHLSVIGNDEISEIKRDKQLKVVRDSKRVIDGLEDVKIAKTLKIDVGQEITIVTGQSSINMKSSGEITIKGQKILIDGAMEVAVKSMKVKVDGSMAVEAKAGVNMKLEGTMVTVKAGAILKEEGAAMTIVKGGLVTIN